MNKNPPFITFEGGEGSGKTTQIKLLAEWLRGQGIDIVTTREPGGNPGGDQIRALLVEGETNRWDNETDTLLNVAARRHGLVNITLPALARGAWVISDRYMDSTYAYQCFGRGLPLDKARMLFDFIDGIVPDLTFFMDIDVRVGIDRALHGKGRALHEDRYEKYGLDFHQKLRDGYKQMAAEEPNRFVTIDATPDMDTVQHALRAVITARFLL